MLLSYLRVFNSMKRSLEALAVIPRHCSSNVNAYTSRTHNCGQLRAEDDGKQVTLCGWIQYQRMGMFVTLRDAYGTTQLIVPNNYKLSSTLSDLPFESVIQVTGKVTKRPKGQENAKMSTGAVEVCVDKLKVISACQPNLPINVRDHEHVKETLRSQYRYLELRKKKMQRNLRFRSDFVMKLRQFMCSQGFVDVETPTLFRRTPGGAREFIVPTHKPGMFYSLTQSPQQFKQLLMIGGLDRYFQIARCYRDESSKPDRQPEFTQVDIELSFVNQEGVMSLVENMLQNVWPGEKGKLTIPFPRLTYEDAMNLYGTDKPDTRFDLKFHDVTDLMRKTNIPLMRTQLIGECDERAKAIVVKNAKQYLTSSNESVYNQLAKEHDLEGMLYFLIDDKCQWTGKFEQHVPKEILRQLGEHLNVEAGDGIFIAGGKEVDVLTLCCKVRVQIAEFLDRLVGGNYIDKNAFNFVWVVDFPLFLPDDDGKLECAHHPFTAPCEEDADVVYTDPLKVRSQHYDLVLNGQEVGGGSIRIHDARLQEYILGHILKEDTANFYYLLDALKSGCPPHGGIALGLERLLTILVDGFTIRDVMAFPKSYEGKDLLSGAPVPIPESDYKYYHLQTVAFPKEEEKEKLSKHKQQIREAMKKIEVVS